MCRKCQKIYRSQHYNANKDYENAQSVQYKLTHKQEIKDYNINYRTDHPEEIKAYGKRYNIENRDKKRAYINGYRARNPTFKMAGNLRARIRKATNKVFGGDSIKLCSTRELMGLASWDDLKPYLEPLLWPGMTWSNHGRKGWHLDHIVPIDAFDKADPQWEFKAFHYKNLQPLWEEHNLAKSSKILSIADWLRLYSLKIVGWMPERIRDK